MVLFRRGIQGLGALAVPGMALSCSPPPPAEMPPHDHPGLSKRLGDEMLARRVDSEALAKRLEAAEEERKALYKRVDSLETKLEEVSKRPPPAGGWSCAGKCQLSFSCKSNGTSKIDWRDITGNGATAAEAWKELNGRCDDVVFVQAQCKDGHFVRVDATIPNACAKN